jgi:hypothetical protein
MIQMPSQALSDTSIHSLGELKGNLTSFHMRVSTVDVMDAPSFAIQFPKIHSPGW